MRRMVMVGMLFIGCASNKEATGDLQLGFTVASQRAQLAEIAVQDLQDRVVELEEILKEQGLDRASGMQTVEQIASEIARLRGDIEVLQFGLQAVRADFDQYQIDQERRTLHAEARLAQLEQLLAVSPPPPPRLDVGLGTTDTQSTPSSDDVAPVAGIVTFEDALATAEQRMSGGQQAAARAILQRALGEDANHPLAAEAKYRIGETWFNEGKWKEAARNFQVVTEQHAKSPWAPWSMLRIGECFEGMGKREAAETFYDGVMRNFPGTDAAKEAAGKLGRR